MIPSRNAVGDAVLALIGTVAAFKTKQRRFVMWDGIPDASRPALMQWEPGDTYTWKNEVEGFISLRYEEFLYLTPGREAAISPVVDVNDLLDAIDAVLKPTTPMDKALGRLTLNNLVYNCRIDGEVVKISGDVSDISLVVIPVRVLVPQVSIS